MTHIKLLTVDDSALMQKILKNFCEQHTSTIEHIGQAFDAHEARKMIKQFNPDVITLDVEMPGMNGLEFLERLMNVRPLPVIMCSSHTAEGTEITLKALELGAVDFLQKPRGGLDKTLDYFNEVLLPKLISAKNMRPRSLRASLVDLQKNTSEISETKPVLEKNNSQKDIIAIGASTGGVTAISTVLKNLPNNLPPIVMTQHMPEGFTERFAQRLDKECALTVFEAKEGMILEQGHAYLAPGGYHMEIIKGSGGKYQVTLNQKPLMSGHRPSVDVLFHSLADCTQSGKVLTIMLTGMGRDGAEGMLNLKKNNHTTLAQNQATCVVYGMPKAAVEIGAVEQELPLDKIPNAILDILSSGSKSLKKYG